MNYLTGCAKSMAIEIPLILLSLVVEHAFFCQLVFIYLIDTEGAAVDRL